MNHLAVRPALLVLTLAATSALAQTQPSLAFTRAQHLQRGINVSHWFSQSANDYSAHHTATETDDADIDRKSVV